LFGKNAHWLVFVSGCCSAEPAGNHVKHVMTYLWINDLRKKKSRHDYLVG